MAGPFTRADFEKLVPADKKLSPEWLSSLTARGARSIYRAGELEKIGMPVGGLCAGQVYLGGDGRLWHWDIFNKHTGTGAEHYAAPMPATSPLEQGFAVRVRQGDNVQLRRLRHEDWQEITFNGEYPIGSVRYRDPVCPLTVQLEAFSPFIPMNSEDSSLPATVVEITLQNSSQHKLEVELAGWLENAVCLNSAKSRDGIRRNRLARRQGAMLLECTAAEAPRPAAGPRPDIVFDDFEREDYGDWTATGTAFGSGPVEISKIPEYQGDVGAHGRRVVNSHASAPGASVGEKDAATGTLTSPTFTIERNYITFLLGGGHHRDRTCMKLLVDGQPVLSETGEDNNRMRPVTWDVRKWAGRSASLLIVDREKESWGNIGVDDIVFSDQPREPLGSFAEAPDYGSMALALLRPSRHDSGCVAWPEGQLPPKVWFDYASSPVSTSVPFGKSLIGSLKRKLKLAPGTSAKATFVVSWFMPNLQLRRLPPGRFYGTKFTSAAEVARYVAAHYSRLTQETRLWHDTWYDSSLPYWFLDRTFLNTSILATSTCYRLGNGRFYGWEGVGCCEGTCGHVWQYAHAVARLFPTLERETREKVDFGLALQPDGAIFFRGEFNNIPAIDAQSGTILRALREHQMCTDNTWLKRNWPGIRRATEWLIAKDGDGDGLITSNQHNTLDTDWFGPVAWLSGLYVAALAAAATMADLAGDGAFGEKCRKLASVGEKNLVGQLFDGDYFINKVDSKHLDAINSGDGCHIDQVMGQSWAFQVGLPRVLPEKETRTALRSLWRYNFTPDVGPYRKAYTAGRWYAMPGEAGLLMCTFPRSDWDYPQAKGKGADWAAGYFNECMNGFEYQVAGHMLREGMVTEGLAITRALHDRYHPARRNPFNEVECGDHYARSMASYGVFLSACGFEYDGPRGHIGFAPKLTPENFKCAFTSAEGWGSFEQKREQTKTACTISVRWGNLQLKTLALEREAVAGDSLKVTVGRNRLAARSAREGNRLLITLDSPQVLRAGQTLRVTIG